jgi:hypothetical protein
VVRDLRAATAAFLAPLPAMTEGRGSKT